MEDENYKETYVKEIFNMYNEIQFNIGNKFNIFHIYDTKEKAHPVGYADANWIKLKCFNTKDKTVFNLEKEQDAITLSSAEISNIRIFLDNSVCITLQGDHKFDGIFQDSCIVKV